MASKGNFYFFFLGGGGGGGDLTTSFVKASKLGSPHSNSGRHRSSEIWRAIPHCLMWCLWRERNARSFEGCERSIIDLKSQLLKTLFDWMLVIGLFSLSLSYLDFLDHCSIRA
jgi:hypothetical protein